MDFIFSASTHLKNICNTLLDLAILRPLRNLYFDGPTVLGVGFWEKLPQKDICSRLTGVSATFWDKADASEECKDLLSRKFDTFIVGAFTLGYIWVIYKVFSYVLFRVFVLRPITNEIKEEMRRVFQFSDERHSDERDERDKNSKKNKEKK